MKPHQLADKYLKEMAALHAEAFLNLLHPKGKYEVLTTTLDKELIVRRRESDFVVKVRIRRRVYLFHFEFLIQYRRGKVRDAYGYGDALTLKYKCDVATVLFVLKPPSRKAQALGQYEVAPFEQPLNRHNLAVIKLWELREAILSGRQEYVTLVPLLTEISPQIDKTLLRRQRELLAQVQDPKLRNELKFYTVAFAQKYFGTKFLMNFFKEKNMYEHWEQVPIFGDHIKRKAKESWQKGREAGLEVARQNISDVLKMRFGAVNGPFERALKAIEEPKKLQVVFRRVLKADSLATVEKILEGEKPLPKSVHPRRKRQGN